MLLGLLFCTHPGPLEIFLSENEESFKKYQMRSELFWHKGNTFAAFHNEVLANQYGRNALDRRNKGSYAKKSPPYILIMRKARYSYQNLRFCALANKEAHVLLIKHNTDANMQCHKHNRLNLKYQKRSNNS